MKVLLAFAALALVFICKLFVIIYCFFFNVFIVKQALTTYSNHARLLIPDGIHHQGSLLIPFLYIIGVT